MKTDDLVDEQGSHVRRRHGLCRGDEDCLFSKSVDHHENCVVVLAGRQVRNPVQGHTAPGLSGDRKGVQEAVGRVTTAHVALDSCCQTWPFEVLRHECLRPRHAVVPRQRCVMVLM